MMLYALMLYAVGARVSFNTIVVRRHATFLCTTTVTPVSNVRLRDPPFLLSGYSRFTSHRITSLRFKKTKINRGRPL